MINDLNINGKHRFHPHLNQVALVTTSRHADISPTNFKNIQQKNHDFKYYIYMSLNRKNAKVALQILLRP